VNVASSDFKIGGSFSLIRIVWEEREKVNQPWMGIKNPRYSHNILEGEIT
jgi:hypothetical protein